jgi:NADPH:quinone reductase-like Zn-dependent oxidoreductase
MDRKTWSVAAAVWRALRARFERRASGMHPAAIAIVALLAGSFFVSPARAAIPTVVVPAQEPIPQTQQQYRLFRGRFFHSYDLKMVEAPVPRPGPFEVLVKVRAVSLNHRDLYIANGVYPMKPRKSLVPLSDGAGEVVAIGGNVTRFKIGDHVAAIYYQNWFGGNATPQISESALGGELDGMLSQYVKLNEQGLVLLPKNLTFEEGATLPCAGVTAWSALFTRGNLQPGESVLLEGTGGVSIFGLQFAAAQKAKPIITSSSDKKLERARLLGAVGTINYKEEKNWEARARELTDGIGVRHVLDVGGEDTLPHAIAAIANGGQIALVGGLGGFSGKLAALQLIPARVTVNGISVGSREDFEAMNAFIEKNNVRPVIDKVFEFTDAREAYELMDSGGHFGKIVIRL